MLFDYNLIAGIVVGYSMLLSGVSKATHWNSWIQSTGEWRLPGTLATLIRPGLPIVEVILGAHLLVGRNLRVTVPITIVLLFCFLLVQCHWLISRRVVPCGCNGSSDEPVSNLTILRVALLIALASFAMFRVEEEGARLLSPEYGAHLSVSVIVSVSLENVRRLLSS